jgi:SpoVK/Ycf46/Vps4 family AAA+-type ATPase
VGQLAALGERSPASGEEARELARTLTRPSLGELGTLLATPYDFSDLIVTAGVRSGLRDLCFEAGERSAMWASPAVRRLYARGGGLVALFCGPPGTGKTMAAQVIARELGLDLIRIDLASVVSKFIGETAKNLRRIFDAAADAHAILLFDEADALFTRRTDVRDAHDRHANTDTNYLLQLIEDYRGLALLASNQRQHIDPAFVRRIRYVFELARPERGERLALWRALVREVASAGELELLAGSLEALAATIDLSGAQIKQALLTGLFAARREHTGLAMAHLIRGVERELEKEGRALTPGERERLLHHGR